MMTLVWLFLACFLAIANGRLQLSMDEADFNLISSPMSENLILDTTVGVTAKLARFTTSQVMKGINAGTFYINYDTNVEVLKETIAMSMPGVEAKHVKALTVMQCGKTGPCMESEYNDFGDKAPFERSENKILITYLIEAPSTESEYSLFSQLLISTSGPGFDDRLHAAARTNAAVDLYQVHTGPSVTMKSTRSRAGRQLRGEPTEAQELSASSVSAAAQALFAPSSSGISVADTYSPFERAHEATKISVGKVVIVALFAVASFFGHATLLHRKGDSSSHAVHQPHTV